MTMLRLVAISLGLAAASPHDARPAPEYFIDLDVPPEDRWTKVVQPYTTAIQKLVDTYVPMKLVREAIALIPIEKLLPAELHGEVKGISAATGIPVNVLAAMNIVYDVTAHCTSIIAQDSSGRVVHGRNLDYDAPDLLQNITITAHFRSKNCSHNPRSVCYSTTTYAGYTGALTGMRPGAFSVSIDERDSEDEPDEKPQSLINNVIAALLAGGTGPSLLTRMLLATPNATYDSALRTLVRTPLAAPVYFILGGVRDGQGAVVTRDRIATQDVRTLSGGKWYVVETNYDDWRPAPKDDDRRDVAERALEAIGPQGIDSVTMYKTMSSSKVLNSGTTYTTVMAAGDGSFNSTIRFDKPLDDDDDDSLSTVSKAGGALLV